MIFEKKGISLFSLIKTPNSLHLFLIKHLKMSIMIAKEKKQEKEQSGILGFLDSLQKQKYAAGKKSTATLYGATRKQLADCFEKKNISLKRINAHLVKEFQDYLDTTKLKPNSKINYLSIFRTAYNCAVSNKLIVATDNPFKNQTLRPLSTLKRSVTVKLIEEIMDLELSKKKQLEFARDLFLFSFMACGMAFVDLAHLTYDNIQDNMIIYYRKKTKTRICITITPGMRLLIQKYANPETGLLFPVLKSADEPYEKYKVALRTYNRRLDTISKKLTNPIKLTSYVARHSWAMCAKRLEAPVALIGQAFGHRREGTTLFYLTTLDQNDLDDVNMKVIAPVEKWLIKGKKIK